MRIAVLLSGQLRQWDYAKHNQKWFWADKSLNSSHLKENAQGIASLGVPRGSV